MVIQIHLHICLLFLNATSILEVMVVIVHDSTRTAIKQFEDPACAAAQEHVETRI